MQPTINTALYELLSALGFVTMAREARDDKDESRFPLYARVVLKNAPAAFRAKIRTRFEMLGLA